MKRNYIASLLVLAMAGFTACRQNKPAPDLDHHQKKAMVMDHDRRDTSLNYLLKPVNEQVIARIPVIQASAGSRIYVDQVQGRATYDTRNQVSISSRVSGRIEKLYIKYNYQPVKKGQLILEIYSPDLAAAQRELLLIQRSGDQEQMLQPAKQRLRLLGMTEAGIQSVLKTGKVSYRIPLYSNASGYILEKQSGSTPAPALQSAPATAGGMDAMGASESPAASSTASQASAPTAVLLREGQYLNAGQNIFTVYQAGNLVAEFSLRPAVAANLSKQSKVIVQRTADKTQSFTGKIGLVQPVFNAGENFVLARVYLKNNNLQVGELLTGQLPMLASKGFWLPKEAVVSLGNQMVVFKKEGQVFVPKLVKTGIQQDKEIQVLEEIGQWQVAKNAYYLIDSESFIKTKNEGV
ncbi:copper ABC transporter [Pedobacter sp. HMWF019]|uniref:efflux RND transporter periplasmic adaptor subunit n=1 Tax=Pedobacter sp. HMWF019 TaxID=2056856 RepID=UPI000D33C9C9|nr:efflux RND transporter periplasmic adaptor subunit [Pedobacter sp. HMWF019]PTS99157.1 copper ABC transporter [Pedobacter sp. HMWF019]